MPPKGDPRKCSQCGENKPRNDFSGSQWVQYNKTRRCKACAAGTREQLGAAQFGRMPAPPLSVASRLEHSPSAARGNTGQGSKAGGQGSKAGGARKVDFDDSPSGSDGERSPLLSASERSPLLSASKRRLSFPTASKQRDVPWLNDTHLVSYLVPSLGEDGFLADDGGWESAVIVAVPRDIAAGSNEALVKTLIHFPTILPSGSIDLGSTVHSRHIKRAAGDGNCHLYGYEVTGQTPERNTKRTGPVIFIDVDGLRAVLEKNLIHGPAGLYCLWKYDTAYVQRFHHIMAHIANIAAATDIADVVEQLYPHDGGGGGACGRPEQGAAEEVGAQAAGASDADPAAKRRRSPITQRAKYLVDNLTHLTNLHKTLAVVLTRGRVCVARKHGAPNCKVLQPYRG